MHLLLSMTIFLLAQTTLSPAPQASATPAASADLSKLTPEQQAAVRAYVVKASQNPVGNIAIIPFQFNNNYALGPYARYQFNVNIQPVVPLMLSKSMTLIARTIIPVLVNPSNLPPQLCPPNGVCGSHIRCQRHSRATLLCAQDEAGRTDRGAGPIFQFPTASPDFSAPGQMVGRPGRGRLGDARVHGLPACS